MKRQPTLFRRFPALAGRVPWTPLASLPTPVERLSPAGLPASLWIKRDDLTGDVYGGNKLRKLEFVLAAAGERGAERLITAGALGSHHALATAIHGRRLGMDATLVLFPQPVTPHVRQVLRLHCAFGAELCHVPAMTLVPFGLLRARLKHRSAPAAVIPPGGSDEVGALGYVDAALELAAQVESGAAPTPDFVYAAAGTLGTVVGLAIGFALAGLEARIVGVRITSRIVVNRLVLRSLIDKTTWLLRDIGVPAPSVADVARRVELRHGRIGRGYGHPTDAGRVARERLADAGLQLDPTYTAKAAAEALAGVRAAPDAVHLFWHTLSASMPMDRAAAVSPDDLPAPFRRFLA